jgi:hypothetical protein
LSCHAVLRLYRTCQSRERPRRLMSFMPESYVNWRTLPTTVVYEKMRTCLRRLCTKKCEDVVAQSSTISSN